MLSLRRTALLSQRALGRSLSTIVTATGGNHAVMTRATGVSAETAPAEDQAAGQRLEWMNDRWSEASSQHGAPVRTDTWSGGIEQAAPGALDAPLGGLPVLKPASELSAPELRISTLTCGLRVATEETYATSSTLGLFVDVGSRREVAGENDGACHVLQHCAFKSTGSRTAPKLIADVEAIGGAVVAQASREHIMYQVEVLREHVDAALEILAEAVLAPRLAADEVEQAKVVTTWEADDVLCAAQQFVTTELVNTAGFGSASPLGQPMRADASGFERLTPAALRAFMAEHFVADKMVLAAAGVNHDDFVAAAEAAFSPLLLLLPNGAGGGGAAAAAEGAAAAGAAGASEGSSEGSSEGGGGARSAAAGLNHLVPSPYVGGELLTTPPVDSLAHFNGLMPLPHASMALCFECGGWSDADLVPVCTLQQLLGGGDSFSAGGPGKGMYSRLYREVLNRHWWVESCTAMSQIHADAGMIGIFGACPPKNLGALAAILLQQFKSLATEPAREEDLARARNQLKSSVLMNLENRGVLFEDIGRQLLTYGFREHPADVCAKIDAVTAEDIMRVGRRAIASNPTVVGYANDLSHMPAHQLFVDALRN